MSGLQFGFIYICNSMAFPQAYMLLEMPLNCYTLLWISKIDQLLTLLICWIFEMETKKGQMLKCSSEKLQTGQGGETEQCSMSSRATNRFKDLTKMQNPFLGQNIIFRVWPQYLSSRMLSPKMQRMQRSIRINDGQLLGLAEKARLTTKVGEKKKKKSSKYLPGFNIC